MDSIVTSQDLRRARRILYKNYKKEHGTPLPGVIKELIATIASNEFRGRRRADLPQLLRGKIDEYPKMLGSLEGLSAGVDEDSKALVDKLAKGLDEKHLVFVATLKHMPVIAYCQRISEDMTNELHERLSKDTQVFFTSFLYVAFFELAEELLFDIVLEITKEDTDEMSTKLRIAHQQKPYLRGALIQFLKNRGYLPEGRRGAFFDDLGNFRDMIAHLLAYYDRDRCKLYIDGEYVDTKIIVERYEQMLKFFYYLMWVFSRTPALLKAMKELETTLPAAPPGH